MPFFLGKRKYQCIFCEKNYTRKYRLKQHVLRQHFFSKNDFVGSKTYKALRRYNETATTIIYYFDTVHISR